MHRDQKLLVMEYAGSTMCRLPALANARLFESMYRQISDHRRDAVSACTGAMSATKNNRLVYMRNIADV